MVVESLEIRKPGNPNSVHITPDGVWVSGKGGVMASIQLQDGMPSMTVADHRKHRGGHQWAFYCNAEGEPYLQLHRPGKEMITIAGDKLTALFS